MSKKDIIEKLLRKETDGLTISELSKILKISRNTVAVALAELKGEGNVRVREVGMCKLHYWK